MISSFIRNCALARYKCKTVALFELSSRRMSEKQDNILNAADSWFNKYNSLMMLSENTFKYIFIQLLRYAAVEDAPEGIFKGVSDRFNGITVDSNLETCLPDKFTSILQSKLK